MFNLKEYPQKKIKYSYRLMETYFATPKQKAVAGKSRINSR